LPHVGEQPFFLGLENGALAAFERGTWLMRSSAFTVLEDNSSKFPVTSYKGQNPIKRGHRLFLSG
jgi:hypothetical protein